MRPRLAWRCPHSDRQYRALGLCNACYLKQNGGSKRWYTRHQKQMIRNVAKWNKQNPSKRRAIARKWAHRRYQKDSTVFLLRNRIVQALRRNVKSASTRCLLGCSIAKLKQHLESQFLRGMSWKNHNAKGWHIDHKIPCSVFDLSRPDHQRACFHYTNLQPLWAFDNLSKGNRV